MSYYHRSNGFVEVAVGIVISLVLVAIFAAITAVFTMLLWNWLMPTIFGLVEISFWQAFGVNLLCGILFKSSISSKSSD